MNKRTIVSLVLLGLTLLACDDKKPDGASASASASAATAASAPMVVASASAAAVASAAPVATAGRGVPSQADEAISASKEIDKGNYKKELDAIEKELK